MSPTTPGHTPEESLPGSPDNKTDAGIVYGFFTSLKNAIYGQQRKEHRSKKQRLKMEDNRHKLRILEAVEEAGVDAIFSDKESTPLSMPDLTIDAMPANLKQISVTRGQDKVPFIGLSDFDARYLPALDDFDELADIAPGMLTLTGEAPRDPQEYTEQWIGQLTVPSFTSLGRPSLESKEFGKVPEQQGGGGGGSGSVTPRMIGMAGRGPGRILSPSENKAGLGVPGRPGTGALGGVRTDLGTIPGTGVLGEKNIDLGKIAQPSVLEAPRIDLGTVPRNRDEECEDDVEPQQQGVTRGMVQSHSFMGSIANMFFGRKGGYT